jgi:hypothetical protein
MQAAGARRRNLQEQNEALLQSQHPVTQNTRSRARQAGRGQAGFSHPQRIGPPFTAPEVQVDSNQDQLDSPPEQGEEGAIQDSTLPDEVLGDNAAAEMEIQEENEVEDDLGTYQMSGLCILMLIYR